MIDMRVISTRAVLAFKDHTGKVGTVSIPRARFDLSGQDALAAMQHMIDSGAFEHGNLEGGKVAKGAKLVQTKRGLIV